MPTGTPTPIISQGQPPKVFLFDVFGTVCDWRGSITKYLIAQTQPNSPLTDAEWETFTVDWHNIYLHFVKSFVPETDQWQTIDQMYRKALDHIVEKWKIEKLWTAQEKDEINTVWHKLDSWADSSKGLAALNKGSMTSTLSNGNVALLTDLAKRGNLPFTHVQSAEDFGAYKPHEKVYLGGARALGFETGECCFVAAHLNDLKAAKSHGYQVAYVARPKEEEWDDERVERERKEGWVDVWVDSKDGFLEVARRTGCVQ